MSKAVALVEGTFGATGQSAAVELKGKANILINGGDGTVKVTKSFDEGATYYVVSQSADGTEAAYATATLGLNGTIDETEPGVLYQLDCTVWASGVITYRISQ